MWRRVLTGLTLALACSSAGLIAATARAGDDGEGPTGVSRSAIIGGDLVSAERQKDLGLVTVGGGCSGTLINRYWVLTADHCVSSDGSIGGPDAAFASKTITAEWTGKTAVPTRFVRYYASRKLDVALIYLADGDLGNVGTRLIYPNAPEADQTVTSFGRGICQFAKGQGATATPTQFCGYMSAAFTIKSVGTATYSLPKNAAGQIIGGGDSGGPDYVTTPDGVLLGIAGVHSTCNGKYMAGKDPAKEGRWTWTIDIDLCESAVLYSLRDEIVALTRDTRPPTDTDKLGAKLPDVPVPDSRPAPFTPSAGQLYQLHQDGSIWAYTGAACRAEVCTGWIKLDGNTATRAIAAAGQRLYQLHKDGSIWRYTGLACSASGDCFGWEKLDANPATTAIAAGGGALYQLHKDGKIWRFTGAPCTGESCTGWQLLDNNPATRQIVADGAALFQRHGDAGLYQFTGTPCAGETCLGWRMLDNNPSASGMAAGGGVLFQTHASGQIWRYRGQPCVDARCLGWDMLDSNPAMTQIAASSAGLFQRHSGGAVWRATGAPCVGAACAGWVRLDRNPETLEIAAGTNALYQRHKTGRIYRWTGAPCAGDSCPGWEMLDNNPATSAIVAAGL